MNTRQLGKLGEDIARQYLEDQSFTFVAANVHCRFSELDLVMCDGNNFVFVEVKYRRSKTFGTPEEGISKQKLERLYAAAEWYINVINWKGSYRIDVVSILQKGNRSSIDHFRNVGS